MSEMAGAMRDVRAQAGTEGLGNTQSCEGHQVSTFVHQSPIGVGVASCIMHSESVYKLVHLEHCCHSHRRCGLYSVRVSGIHWLQEGP